MQIGEFKNILQFEYDRRAMAVACSSIIIISCVFTALAGWKALIGLGVPVLIWITYRSFLNLLWVFIAVHPFLIFVSASAYSLSGYLVAFIIVSFWLAESFINNFKNLHISKELTWLMISFIFIALVSIMPGGLTRNEIFTFVRIIILFTFVFAFYDLFSPKDTVKIFIAISIPALINAIQIMRIFLSVNSVFDFLSLMRMKVGGLFLTANQAGYMFMLAIPFWIAYVLWHPELRTKILSAATAFTILVALFLTSARASILGVFVSIFVFAVWKRKLRYCFGIILLVLIIIFSSSALRDLISIVARVDRGVTSRDLIWANTFEMIKENWVFGIGIGNFSERYEPYLVLAWDKGFYDRVAHAHNFILSKTVELGMLGFIWVLFFYFIPAKTGFDLLKYARSDRDKAIIYGILATILGLYAHSLFEASGMLQEARFMPEVLFWIIIAALLKAKARHNNRNMVMYQTKERIF